MVRELIGRAIRGELSRGKSLLLFGGFAGLSLWVGLLHFPDELASAAIIGAMGLAWLGFGALSLSSNVASRAYLRARQSLAFFMFACVVALGIVELRDALVRDNKRNVADSLDPGKTSLNISKFLVPTAAHPFTGFWKSTCSESFGFAIHPASPGRYAVCFCGPGGCSKPGVSCSEAGLTNSWGYRVIDSNTLEKLGLDGYSRYVRCTPSFASDDARAARPSSAADQVLPAAAAVPTIQAQAVESRSENPGSSTSGVRVIAPAIPVESGNVAFIKAVHASLELLRERAPEDFAFARTHVGLIREVARWEDRGMAVMRDPPVANLQARYYMESRTWLASVIVHEACHRFQYLRGTKRHGTRFPPNYEFSGRIAELECLKHQAEVLERLGAPAAEIASVRSADGRHYRRDEHGKYKVPTPDSWWDPSASDPRSVPSR